MKYIYTALLVLILYAQLAASSTDETSKFILAEGKLLYRLEKASWYATDYLRDNYRSKLDSIGGYVSFQKDHKVSTIFFSKHDSTVIIASLVFDSIPAPKPISFVQNARQASPDELDLIIIRQDARWRAYAENDTLYRHYKNTSFNFIPLIKGDYKRVFILTSTHETGYVVLGNDYLLTYKANNTLDKQERLHNGLLQFPYSVKDNVVECSYHKHILSDFITSTDICTLLLYKKFIDWKMHLVFSEKYVSNFNLETERLSILTTEAYDKIYKQIK